MFKPLLLVVSLLPWTDARAEPQETVELRLRTRTGGVIEGFMVAHNDHGVVIVHERTPYVFSWRSLETGSAYAARRKLLEMERGGPDQLTADDRFLLGAFALSGGRNDIAAIEFREAAALDETLKPRIQAAFEAFRRRQRDMEHAVVPPPDASDPQNEPSPRHEKDAAAQQESGNNPSLLADSERPADDGAEGGRQARIMEAYGTFNQEVARVLGEGVVTTETEHFLLTTDLPPREVMQLGAWCEAMYAALAAQFRVTDRAQVFLAKCPVYCFRNRARFTQFARHFDGFDARDSIGYTRSIEANGHTHVVLLREGRDEADVDRFACTLVHEGAHAFLHRLYSTRLIPHWVNEGLADLMADRVLGDRCGKRADAALLAECYVRYDWPIRQLLESAAPIAVEQYPLAHSVVRFMYDHDAEAFVRFVRQLKAGADTSEALNKAYDGWTLDALESAWRSWIRGTMPPREQ